MTPNNHLKWAAKESFLKKILLLLSLVIFAFGHPSYSPFLSLFASSLGMALFWASIWPFTKKQRAFFGFIWFFLVSASYLSWMSSSEYHGVYIWIVYVGLCLGLGAQFGVLTYFLPMSRAVNVLQILSFSAAWTLMEWSRLFFLCGFPFNPTGISLTAYVLPLQFAALGGIFLLSFWVLMTNFFALNLIFNPKKGALFKWLAIALVPYLFGAFHLMLHQYDAKKIENLSIALIQTGLKPEEKTLFLKRMRSFVPPLEQWERALHFLKSGDGRRIDLILFPEAAFPYGAHLYIYALEEIASAFKNAFEEFDLSAFPPLIPPFAAHSDEGAIYVNNAFIAQTLSNYFHADCIIGLDDYSLETEESYNAAFHFKPYNYRSDRYEKRVLVPLAEYLPFSFLRPIVSRYGISDFFTPGKEAKIFRGQINISPSICYEECFSHLMREGRIKGANLFVNLTNDNFFPSSILPKQHFDHGRVRAVENGIPLLRACNTGVTAAVDVFGRALSVIEEKGSFEKGRGVLFLSIASCHFQTPYVFWGNFFIISLCFGILFCAFIFYLYIKIRKIVHNGRFSKEGLGSRP